jgi:hypothetical protein
VVRVAKRAWRLGYHGLAAVIAVAWDTQLSPGDVRALRASQLARGAAGEAFFTERGKTGGPVGGILSMRSMMVLSAYLEKLGVELHGDAYVFRNRSGAPYSSDTLGDDFRDVRGVEFGPLERRTIGYDFRRTGAVEAITGGAKADSGHFAWVFGWRNCDREAHGFVLARRWRMYARMYSLTRRLFAATFHIQKTALLH